MAAFQDTLDRTILWLANSADGLHSVIQSIGTPALLIILLIPLLITLTSRKAVLSLAAVLLTLLTLVAFVAPSSIASVLAVLGAASLLLIAAAAVSQRLRPSRLQEQIADIAARLDQLESAESRRTLTEMKRRGPSDEAPSTSTPQKDGADDERTPQS